MFKTIRERLYGGPLCSGPRFHYVTYLQGIRIASAATKDESLALAAKTLLGAYDKQTSSIYASVCADGAVLTTREYAPGEVEQSYHRVVDGMGSGVSMGRCMIGESAVSPREYHAHTLRNYNA